MRKKGRAGGGKGREVQRMQPKGTCYVGEHRRPLLLLPFRRGHAAGGGRGPAGAPDRARGAALGRLLGLLARRRRRRAAAAAGAAAGEPGGAVLEDEQPQHVDGQPQRADDEHQLGVVDALGPRQAQHGLHGDGEAERREEDGVAQRAQHLGARVAVGGPQAPAGSPRHVAGAQPHAQRDQVGQHVEGVGQQRDGVAQVARDQLGHEEGDGEHQHEEQPARLARVAAHVAEPPPVGAPLRGRAPCPPPASQPAPRPASYKAEAERPRAPNVQSLREWPRRQSLRAFGPPARPFPPIPGPGPTWQVATGQCLAF